jgi:hypothetical protein
VRRDGDAPAVGRRANPAPASAGPWASLVYDARISYVSRMVNLTALAPEIVAAILDETLPADVTLFDLAVDPSALWEEQRRRIGMLL